MEGKSREDHTAGCSQTSSSILTGCRSEIHYECLNQAGHYSHMCQRLSHNRQIVIHNLHYSVACQGGKSCSRQAGQSTTLRSHCTLLHTALPPSQTSTWEQRRAASQHAPPPPIQAQDTTEEAHRQDELLKGCPNRGPWTCRHPAGAGGLSLLAGTYPEKGLGWHPHSRQV